jgi:hypothetical protein
MMHKQGVHIEFRFCGKCVPDTEPRQLRVARMRPAVLQNWTPSHPAPGTACPAFTLAEYLITPGNRRLRAAGRSREV